MAEKETKFWLDQPDTRNIILESEGIRKIEYEYMHKVLDQIRAEFLQTFGFEGDFSLDYEPSRDRERYCIRSRSAKTTRVLNKNPGWLGKFVQQPL